MTPKPSALAGTIYGEVSRGAGAVEKAVSIRPPAYTNHSVIQAVADVLAKPSRFHQAGVFAILEPYGATERSVSLALALAGQGTAHTPNARLRGHGATLDFAREGIVRRIRDQELYPRAAYVTNAALRIAKMLGKGFTVARALAREKRNQKSHETARRGRLEAAAQVQVVAEEYGWETDSGLLVGWYINPLLNNDTECLTADGNNFHAEKGTIIGLPGSVHPNCGCYAGPPHIGGGMVNDAVRKVAKLHQPKKFVLRKKRGA